MEAKKQDKYILWNEEYPFDCYVMYIGTEQSCRDFFKRIYDTKYPGKDIMCSIRPYKLKNVAEIPIISEILSVDEMPSNRIIDAYMEDDVLVVDFLNGHCEKINNVSFVTYFYFEYLYL